MEAFDSSEGSDFEEFLNTADEDGDFKCADPINQELWLRHVFDDDSDVNCDEFEGSDRKWKTQDYRSYPQSIFNRKPGVKVDLPSDATPLQTFSHIFTEELWTHLVTETNRYHEQTQPQLKGKTAKWSPVTLAEMKTFIGLCIGMGLLVLPSRRDYWRQTKYLFKTQFSGNMSRDRFEKIWRNLHLENNQAAVINRDDKLWKMRWYLDYLLAQFKKLYEVDSNVSIGDSVIKCKGRPSSQGVKVWVMAESATGYVTNFQVYAGCEGPKEKGVAHRVVMELTRPYYGSYLSVYMDHFYTGVPLFEELRSRGVYACGTVRPNRTGLPKIENLRKDTSMKNHEFRVAQKDELTFCIWQDTKTVMLLSNHHDPAQMGTVNRRKDGANGNPMVVPSCLVDYQKHMKGVDLLDQMVGYYGFQHRSKKKWRRVFFFFLAVSCHNAYIAAKCVGGTAFRNKYRGYKNWLEDLSEQLITPLRSRPAPGTPPCSPGASPPGSPPPPPAAAHLSPPPPPFVGNKTEPCSSQHDCGKVFAKRKHCRECLLVPDTQRVGGPTVYGCTQCQLPLHIECFGKHYRRFM